MTQNKEAFWEGKIHFGIDPAWDKDFTATFFHKDQPIFDIDPAVIVYQKWIFGQQDNLISQNLAKTMDKWIQKEKEVEAHAYWIPMGYLYGYWLFNRGNEEWMIVSPDREEAYFSYYSDNGEKPKVRMKEYGGKSIERKITPFEFFEESCEKVVIGGDFEHKVKQYATSEIDGAYRRGYDEGFEEGQEGKFEAVQAARDDGYSKGYAAGRREWKERLEDFLED